MIELDGSCIGLDEMVGHANTMALVNSRTHVAGIRKEYWVLLWLKLGNPLEYSQDSNQSSFIPQHS
jgi:hypothetical protein